MKPGPKPTPTRQLKLRGSWRANRPHEPQLEPEAPKPPDWLSEVAIQEWEYAVEQLSPSGVLTKADRNILAQYCQAMSDYRAALEVVSRDGMTVATDKGNLIQHPAVGIKNTSWEQARKAGALLGLSPADRTGIKVDPKQEKPKKGRFFKEA